MRSLRSAPLLAALSLAVWLLVVLDLARSAPYVVLGLGFLVLTAVASARAAPLAPADPPRVERRVGAHA